MKPPGVSQCGQVNSPPPFPARDHTPSRVPASHFQAFAAWSKKKPDKEGEEARGGFGAPHVCMGSRMESKDSN